MEERFPHRRLDVAIGNLRGSLLLPFLLTVVEIQAIARCLSELKEAAVLATLVDVAGSSYRRPGARLLLPNDGSRIGSISGGCLEEDVIGRARQVAATGIPEVVVYDTASENDLIWGVGLGCHGVVRVLLERITGAPRWGRVLAENIAQQRPTDLKIIWGNEIRSSWGTYLIEEPETSPALVSVFHQRIAPPTRLCIFGAGDDVRPLVRFAKELGWHVSIADPRPNFASPTRFPLADLLRTGPAEQLPGLVDPPPEGVAVVMTHHYVHDVPVLRELLKRPLAYIGLLGPRKRGERILRDLRNEGSTFADTEIERLHSPVGLDLGAETPEEVALSIIAEIRAVLAGRDGRPLRERNQPIHDETPAVSS